MFTSLAAKLFLSTLLGAAIGLERENSTQSGYSIGGIRTYSLIGLLGGLCGVFYLNNLTVAATVVAGVFFGLLLISYFVGASATKEFGLTSELSVIITFVIGLLIVLNIISLHLVIAIFVLLVLILSLKPKTKELMAGISKEEVQAFISYAIIALVIFPFLPNVGYKLSGLPVLITFLEGLNINLGGFVNLELINPQRIWMIVVLITGIDVVGYILGRVIGSKKSFTLTSFVAGFISSTSATQSLAQKSKKTGVVNYLVGAAVLANLASFLQIFLLVGPLNAKWLVYIFPTVVIMILAAALLSMAFLRKHETEKSAEEPDATKGKIFSLMPALKFAAILVVIKLITKICLIVFGQSGFVVSSVIASFAGLDAIIVTLAEMAGGAITFKFALLTFLLVNATNLASKVVYTYLQGSKKFANRFLVSAISIIAVSFVGLIFFK